MFDHNKKGLQYNTAQSNAQLPGNRAGKELQDNRPQSVAQKKQVEALAIGKPIQQKNNTGLPDQLKSGIENLSGHSMDDVKVNFNSDKPAQLNAHAYAQGTDIHIASGQEKHLPHEAWHVVQQKQGRVKPTMQMKGKMNINDDKGLEKEADTMGMKALSAGLPEQISKKVIQSRNRYSSLHSHSVYSRKVFQFALPPQKWDTKGLYNATGGKTQIYTGGRPIKFSTTFKKNLLKQWHTDKAFGLMGSQGGNKVYIRTVPGQSDIFANWVPIEAFQIDHHVSWNKISNDLRSKGNKQALTAFPNAMINGKPTEYAAKMYYHDYGNLRPMQGSENAGKGAKSSGHAGNPVTHQQLEVEKYVTRKYLSIMDSLQNGYRQGKQATISHLNDYWFKKGGKGKQLLNKAEEETKSTKSGAPATPVKSMPGLIFGTPQ